MKLNQEGLNKKNPKQLRTIRNQLNNRISSFENGNAKELKPSHPLFDLDLDQCKEILLTIKTLLKSK